MVFSSPIFLFLFLPPALLIYYVLPSRWRALRNLWLTLISLVRFLSSHTDSCPYWRPGDEYITARKQ